MAAGGLYASSGMHVTVPGRKMLDGTAWVSARGGEGLAGCLINEKAATAQGRTLFPHPPSTATHGCRRRAGFTSASAAMISVEEDVA